MELKPPPVCLTIAGSDSGGGAGIQADLKTFQALGCFGTSVLTAITAQNTTGVTGAEAVSTELVVAQLHAVLADFPVRAAKTGMLFSASIIRALHKAWQDHAPGDHRKIPLVIDPVMVATSGARLLQTDAREALRELLPLATVVTPNLPEAGELLGRDLAGGVDMRAVALELEQLYGVPFLVKGGHQVDAGALCTDVLAIDGVCQTFSGPRVDTRSTHGTGCTLSAAIAASLARGKSLPAAIESARDFLTGALVNAPGFGAGSGPLNHLWRAGMFD